MSTTWRSPHGYRQRPVAIIGAGVHGRQIGCIWASAGYDVHIYDPIARQRADGMAMIGEYIASISDSEKACGSVKAFKNISDAVKNAWLAIDSVPEVIESKRYTFDQLDKTTPVDCILASTSSSYRSSEMLQNVSPVTMSLFLNMHFYMPPRCMIVELMASSHTAQGILPFIVERCKEAGAVPYVRDTSSGFILNRIWMTIKREILTILAEGGSSPEEIDSMWTTAFIKSGEAPCKLMDAIGLDTVAFVESHSVKELGLPPAKSLSYLRRNYLDLGKLGTKSPEGGLYLPSNPKEERQYGPRIFVLDIGLSATTPTMHSGSILECSRDGTIKKVLVRDQALPDGLAIDPAIGRLFWTNMGVPGKNDGAVYSCNLDGGDVRVVVAPGLINTPKQLTLDTTTDKVYFCDREGLRVYRCNYNGSDVEMLFSAGDSEKPEDAQNAKNWCVGVTVAPKLGKFYWTQKGPSKGGQGRIFCANIPPSSGGGAAAFGSDIQCILSGLPEPIDLEIDEETRLLYWTDRGEVPFGNSLNKIQLDETGLPGKSANDSKHQILTRHLKEAIGLKLDTDRGDIYLTDIGGNIYRCDLDGKNKEKILSDDFRAFTGITLV